MKKEKILAQKKLIRIPVPKPTKVQTPIYKRQPKHRNKNAE